MRKIVKMGLNFSFSVILKQAMLYIWGDSPQTSQPSERCNPDFNSIPRMNCLKLFKNVFNFCNLNETTIRLRRWLYVFQVRAKPFHCKVTHRGRAHAYLIAKDSRHFQTHEQKNSEAWGSQLLSMQAWGLRVTTVLLMSAKTDRPKRSRKQQPVDPSIMCRVP